jgi:hypothetical protein
VTNSPVSLVELAELVAKFATDVADTGGAP